MSHELPDPPNSVPPTEEEKRLIETLYRISVDDIRELKNRQWDVTKWVLAANVALFIPIALKGQDLAPTDIMRAIALLSSFLAVLAAASILKTQWSLKGT